MEIKSIDLVTVANLRIFTIVLVIECVSIATYPLKFLTTFSRSLSLRLLNDIRSMVEFERVVTILQVIIYQPLLDIIKIL